MPHAPKPMDVSCPVRGRGQGGGVIIRRDENQALRFGSRYSHNEVKIKAIERWLHSSQQQAGAHCHSVVKCKWNSPNPGCGGKAQIFVNHRNKNCIHEEIKSRLNSWNAYCHCVQNLTSSRLPLEGLHMYIWRPFEKFVDWWWLWCAAVMQREAVTIMPNCSGEGNVVVAWSSSL